jgi:16S rRNA (cytosine967-C5)-methyltransferase
MVYATCTLEPEETREVVEDFLSGHPGWCIVPAGRFLQGPAATMTDENGFLVIFPSPGGPDGFFAAILRNQTHEN